MVAAFLTFAAATFGTAAIAHGPVAWLIAGTAATASFCAMVVLSWALRANPDLFKTEAELRARLTKSDDDLDQRVDQGMLLERPDRYDLKTSKRESMATPDPAKAKENENG